MFGVESVVEALGVGGLVGGEAAASHGHVVAVEDGADGAALDAEFLGQFVDGGTSLVVGDELLGPSTRSKEFGLCHVRPTTLKHR
jgi:hypothetical protein